MRASSATSGERFLKKRRPSLEAQIANLADEIAYNNHDVDDGLRSGLLELEQLSEVTLFKRHVDAALKAFPGLSGRRLVHETVRRMIDTLVTDLIAQAPRISGAPASVDDVRRAPALIAFSDGIRDEQLELKRFLHENLYRHYRVARMSSKARRIVTELFGAFLAEPNAPAAGIPGARRRGQDARHRRLHRRHDGSLRHSRAPAAVRDRSRLKPPRGAAAEISIEVSP